MAMPVIEASLFGRAVVCGALLVACAGRGDEPEPESFRIAAQPATPVSAASTAEPTAMGSASPMTPTASAIAPPLLPASVVSLPVDGDLPASLVKGALAPKIVFLPGLCSNANAYLQGFPEAARAAGGVVAIDGEKPCAPGFRSFIRDPPKQHARIQAAFKAAGLDAFPAEGVTVVGYSQGASIAEDLVERWPQIYTRAVLLGSPKDPAVKRVKVARAIVTMSCSLDVPGRMKQAAKKLEALGVPAAYFEMPGCTHGNLAEGDRVFGEVFGWLAIH